ncbi:MAG: hypothetical protein M3454_14905 [Actinomycetota bacterium]|nr:hypothetical protein [Actinomycetota bacterium]
MPVKGKKKAQSRGSQGRRRPAEAPRPVLAPRKPPAWYRTWPGRAVLMIVVLALVGGVFAAIASTQTDDGTAARADALDRYTGEVRGALQSLRPAASDMTAAPTSLTEQDARKALGERAASWRQVIEGSSTDLSRVLSPGAVQSAHSLFLQSTQIYLAAAKTYSLASEVEGDSVDKVLARAAEQRDQGGQLWQSATVLLDERRAEVDLSGSGLTPPSLPPAQPQVEPGSGSGQGEGSGAGEGSGGG